MSDSKISEQIDTANQTKEMQVGKAAFEFLQASQTVGMVAAANALKDQEPQPFSNNAMLAAALMAAAVDELHPNDAVQMKRAIR